jgi:hypothetical protein
MGFSNHQIFFLAALHTKQTFNFDNIMMNYFQHIVSVYRRGIINFSKLCNFSLLYCS